MDLRVLVAPIFAAFAVPATVTRPDLPAILTEGVWISPATEQWPSGSDVQRSTQRRVLALRRDAVPSVPRGTVIVAPEFGGGDALTWRADGFDGVEPDLFRVIVVPVSEEFQ